MLRWTIFLLIKWKLLNYLPFMSYKFIFLYVESEPFGNRKKNPKQTNLLFPPLLYFLHPYFLKRTCNLVVDICRKRKVMKWEHSWAESCAHEREVVKSLISAEEECPVMQNSHIFRSGVWRTSKKKNQNPPNRTPQQFVGLVMEF